MCHHSLGCHVPEAKAEDDRHCECCQLPVTCLRVPVVLSVVLKNCAQLVYNLEYVLVSIVSSCYTHSGCYESSKVLFRVLR